MGTAKIQRNLFGVTIEARRVYLPAFALAGQRILRALARWPMKIGTQRNHTPYTSMKALCSVMRNAFGVMLASFILIATASADVIETIGGSVLRGRVIASDEGVIKIEADFGPTVEIKQDQIKSIAIDDPVFVALENGNSIKGTVATDATGVQVSGQSSELQTSIADITAVWRDGDMSPADKAAAALERKWTYQAAFDLNGRQGNSDRVFLGVTARAELQGPDDRLIFLGNYSQAEENGAKTEDQGKFGIDYSNFFSKRFSWYVRTELGFDGTKDLDLRSQTAAGIGYSIIKRETQSLETRAGISYRFENYGTGTDFDSAGLDLGLIHTYALKWGKMRNSLTFTPSFDDFSNFVLLHDSSLELPIGTGEFWRMRFGIKNDYTSEPPPGLVKHDWTYYSQISLTWD